MIKKNDVVTMTYTLKDSAGAELGSAGAKEPLNYLHGAGNIVPGLEEVIEGAKVGDKKEVTVPPKKGYGDLNPSLKLKLARSQFPPDAKIKPDMQFTSDVDGQQQVFTVERIEGDQVHVNGNHPLAGKTLHFSVEILGVRKATKEELSHGHVHDGHTHH